MAVRDTHGLEFVRAWNRHKVSIVALLPFLILMVFAVTWIAVSIGNFGVDAQVAVQTAFTVARFIVTAGEAESISHVFLWLVHLLTRSRLGFRCTSYCLVCLSGRSVGLD
jgi:hypothetical protein